MTRGAGRDDPVAVRGVRAELFAAYRDARDAIEQELIDMYRAQVIEHPHAFDAATIARVLDGCLRFRHEGRPAFLDVLRRDDGVTFEQLRGGVDVTPRGRAVLDACAENGFEAPLCEALLVRFIEAHPGLVVIIDPDTVESVDADDDCNDGASVPDDAPEGYGGCE